MRLIKIAGQSNDWSLICAVLQLAPTPQCEMRCLSKFALPAHRWVLSHCSHILCKRHHVLSVQSEGQTSMLFPDFNRLVCPCNCARAGPCAYCPSAVLCDSFKMITLVLGGAKLARL